MSTDLLSRLIASHYMAPDDGDQANRAKQNAARTGCVGGAETAGAAARLRVTVAAKRDRLEQAAPACSGHGWPAPCAWRRPLPPHTPSGDALRCVEMAPPHRRPDPPPGSARARGSQRRPGWSERGKGAGTSVDDGAGG